MIFRKTKVTKHLTVGTQMIVIWWPWRDETLLCLSTVWNSDVFPCMSFVWLWTVKSVEAMSSWVLESQLQGMNPLESWSNWIQTVDGTLLIVMCFIFLGHFDGGLWSILIQSPELSPFTHAGGMVFECCLFSYKLAHKSVNCRYTHHKSIHQHSCNMLESNLLIRWGAVTFCHSVVFFQAKTLDELYRNVAVPISGPGFWPELQKKFVIPSTVC